MSAPHFQILYVDNPARSASFYAALLGRPAAQSSPTFAMFALESGAMLGLWSRHTVAPAVDGTGNSGEVAFAMAGDESVTATHAAWSGLGVRVIQPPVRQDFGYTFVALDPDGHRLRVFAPGPPPAVPA